MVIAHAHTSFPTNFWRTFSWRTFWDWIIPDHFSTSLLISGIERFFAGSLKKFPSCRAMEEFFVHFLRFGGNRTLLRAPFCWRPPPPFFFRLKKSVIFRSNTKNGAGIVW